MSFPWDDEAPHIFTRKSRRQPLEFLSTSAKRLLQHDPTNSGHPAALSQHSNQNQKCRTGLSAIEPSLRQKFWILKICKERPAPQTRLTTGYALDFPAIETREYSPKRRTCRTFFGRMEKDPRDGTGWLPWQDSNRQMLNLRSAFEMSSEFRVISERTATGDFSRLS
jgi:hypothetical protein